MKRMLLRLVGWSIGMFVLLLRMTCRTKVYGDPRPALSDQGIGHVFALLHAHQVASSIAADRGTGAMVSRSDDGEIIVPALRIGGHIPIRGSSGTSKGGASALQALIEHVNGGRPAILAVDGPRGPRGKVQKGIGLLSKKTGAAVLAVVTIPSRRWILNSTWDRLQIPKPFSTIHCHFAEPLMLRPGESLEEFTKRVEVSLNRIEAQHDRQQADLSRIEPESGEPNRVAA